MGCKSSTTIKKQYDYSGGPTSLCSWPLHAGGTSIVAKILDEATWQMLKDAKDEDFTFKEYIFNGCRYSGEACGTMYAGSHLSYYYFSPFTDEVIKSLHGGYQFDRGKHERDMGPASYINLQKKRRSISSNLKSPQKQEELGIQAPPFYAE